MDSGKDKSTPVYAVFAPYWDLMQDISWIIFVLMISIVALESTYFLKLCIAQIIINVYLRYKAYSQHKQGVKR